MGCSASSKVEMKFDDYDWKELPDDAKAAAKLLGYSKKIWDNDGVTKFDEIFLQNFEEIFLSLKKNQDISENKYNLLTNSYWSPIQGNTGVSDS